MWWDSICVMLVQQLLWCFSLDKRVFWFLGVTSLVAAGINRLEDDDDDEDDDGLILILIVVIIAIVVIDYYINRVKSQY